MPRFARVVRAEQLPLQRIRPCGRPGEYLPVWFAGEEDFVAAVEKIRGRQTVALSW